MEIDQIELIGGHPALDFVNTVEARGSEAPLNYLADFDSLARWSLRAGLLPPAACKSALRQAASDPQAASGAWRDAMALRDSLSAIFRAVADGAPPPEPATVQLNETLKKAFDRRQLAPTAAGAWRWSWQADDQALASPALEIALGAAALLTDESSLRRVRVCANGPCDWIFLDSSRNGKRRWCRMSVCGNVSKVRRFRQRLRAES
ncbi:MAG: ABATE domain-containing protein [Pseudomonadota bacterium]